VEKASIDEDSNVPLFDYEIGLPDDLPQLPSPSSDSMGCQECREALFCGLVPGCAYGPHVVAAGRARPYE
jgi:hypothetical protein